MKAFRFSLITFIYLLLLTSSYAESTKVGVFLRKEDNYNRFISSLRAGITSAFELHPYSSKVELIEAFHDGTPKEILDCVKLIKGKGVKLIVGGETSSDAIQFLRMYADDQITFITPTSSSSKLNEYSRNVFRVSHSDKNMYKIAEKVLEGREELSLSVFHNVTKPNTNAIGKSITNYLDRNSIEYNKVEVLSDENLQTKKIDMFIEQNKSGLVSMFAFESDLRKFFEVAKKKNKEFIYIGADGWGSNESVKEYYVDKQKNKSLFTGIRLMYWNPENMSKVQRTILAKIAEISDGEEIGAFHAIGYDSMKVALDALADSNRNDLPIGEVIKKKVFEKLLTTSRLKFGADNSANKDLYLYKIDREGIHFWNQVKI